MISKIERAKQFLPFDALNGFREALRKKEEMYSDKIELSSEMEEKLSNNLLQIEKGTEVIILYYHNRKYIKIREIVKKIDFNFKNILLEGDIKIFFDDIYRIEII